MILIWCYYLVSHWIWENKNKTITVVWMFQDCSLCDLYGFYLWNTGLITDISKSVVWFWSPQKRSSKAQKMRAWVNLPLKGSADCFFVQINQISTLKILATKTIILVLKLTFNSKKLPRVTPFALGYEIYHTNFTST